MGEEEVLEVQSKWASAIAHISAVYKGKGDYIAAASDAAGELYAYGHDNVLFKPTKAAEYQFRPTAEEAMSYFVGGEVVQDGYAEDAGFAINGGKGWESCVYDNHQIDQRRGRARDGELLLHLRHDGQRDQGRIHLRLQAL